jgi:predicted N-acetyltransferase YhbS
MSNDNYRSFCQIRRAEYDDIENIMLITREAFGRYREMTGAKKVDALCETKENIKNDIDNKLVFVSLYDGETVGCVRVEILPDKTACLTRFAVKLSCQNNGIGKSMMNLIDKIMIREGVKKIYLYTASKAAPLIRFYYGRGFYVESTDTSRGYIRAKLVKDYE